MRRIHALACLLGGLVLLSLAACGRRDSRPPAPVDRARIEIDGAVAGHPVALLIDPAHPASDGMLGLAWRDALEMAFGGCALLDADQMQTQADSILSGRALLVVPHAFSVTHPATWVDRLRPAVTRGLEVYLETPDTAWARALGLRRHSIERRSHLDWPVPDDGARWLAAGSPPPPRRIRARWMAPRYAPFDARVSRRFRSARVKRSRALAWSIDEGDGRWHILGMDFDAIARRIRSARPGRLEHPWLEAWAAYWTQPAAARHPWPRLALRPDPRRPAPLVRLRRPASARAWQRGTLRPLHALDAAGRPQNDLQWASLDGILSDEGIQRHARRRARLGLDAPLPVFVPAGTEAPPVGPFPSWSEDEMRAWRRARTTVLDHWASTPSGLAVNVRVPARWPVTVLVPLDRGGRSLFRWRAEGDPSATARRLDVAGEDVLGIRLQEGGHVRLVVEYEDPSPEGGHR